MKAAHSPQQLETLIRDGQWPVGTRLPAERALAAQLNCSRAALRELLQKLQAQGLIHTRRGSGSVVTRAQPSPLIALLAQSARSRRELLAVRTAIDAMAAQGAAERATARDRAAIQKQHRRFGAAVDARDLDAMGQADAGFHLAIATASHNKVLLEVVRSLREALEASIAISSQHLFDQSSFSRSVFDQHGAIVAAIVARDPEAAKLASEHHVEQTAKKLRSVQKI
ncbi:MAG: FadR/GntR family transcriptional regulator [Granulosicoccaceae bacterium]